ncbi:helix-turn-helix domain-containing protein [Pseudonocardia adelaidensis]|uniref:helix-turn-helix domain-containing protein n=1 Tax=Pseudonocardia adelaidensis TaxID=648754 RepID=UPI003CD08F35
MAANPHGSRGEHVGWRARLLAHRLLGRHPRYAHLGVSGIAAVVGFRDLRTFERAFRRRYGMTPRECRCAHRRSGSAPATRKQEMPAR